MSTDNFSGRGILILVFVSVAVENKAVADEPNVFLVSQCIVRFGTRKASTRIPDDPLEPAAIRRIDDAVVARK